MDEQQEKAKRFVVSEGLMNMLFRKQFIDAEMFERNKGDYPDLTDQLLEAEAEAKQEVKRD